MQTELIQSNDDLAHQIRTLQELMGWAQIPGTLSGYRSEIESICERLRRQVRRNLKDLSYNQPDILENVLRQTQLVMNELEIINVVYVGPLMRCREEDRLALGVFRGCMKNTQGQLGSSPKSVGKKQRNAGNGSQFKLNNSRAALPYDSPSPNILGGAKDIR